MATQGTAILDFGAFPGRSDTSVDVTGQTGISAGSLVEAWLLPAATADHSADEHWVDPPAVFAGNIVAGTGFTIYASARDGIPVPDGSTQKLSAGQGQDGGRRAPMPYGRWSVAWVWN